MKNNMKMKSKGMSGKGWHGESIRHSQAAKGIKSSYKPNRFKGAGEYPDKIEVMINSHNRRMNRIGSGMSKWSANTGKRMIR